MTTDDLRKLLDEAALRDGPFSPASTAQKPPENGQNRGPGRPRAHPGGEPVVTDPAAGFWPS